MSCPNLAPDAWPAAVRQALWRADQLSATGHRACPTGFGGLNKALPGGGWPTHGLTEILQQQAAPGLPLAEWRLLLPGLRHEIRTGRPLALIGPPQPPHVPGLQAHGIAPAQVLWIQAQPTAERLWATEQLLKGPGAQAGLGGLIAWLPEVQGAHVRRLQILAAACDAPLFLVRPAQACQEASAAPLRLLVSLPAPQRLSVHVLKRRGPAHAAPLVLSAWPPGLAVLSHRHRAAASVPARAGRPQAAMDPCHALAVADSPATA